MTSEGLKSLPLDRMWQRIETARQDSDTALVFDLLYLGELVVKLVTACLVAALDETHERHRYRLEYNLVRATGIGDWVQGLHDLLTGPAASHLIPHANSDRREITQNFLLSDETWQRRAIVAIDLACRHLDPSR